MNGPVAWASLAPFLALAGAVVAGLFGRNLKGNSAGVMASTLVGGGFVLSVIAFFGVNASGPVTVSMGDFLVAGDFKVGMGFYFDQLSVLMMLIITGVGFLIHVFALGYMKGDDGFSRFFAQLNLFVAAMLILVMADSYPLMFVGWEGVGVCSFLLIGFWYKDRGNADAGRKAFIVNRVGDFGFLIAMFLTFKAFGTLNIQDANAAASNYAYGASILTLIGLFYLLAAAGKSAQLPLHVWLPDAMAGPTPVSALIHAATMVTAGVYLIARTGGVYANAPGAAATVVWFAVLTALMAAIIAVGQTDIKRILAWSTISQVGFMVAAVGAGAYWAGIFHVLTHAFFKALLFLGAGSVIHALGGEQDVTRMGGVGRKMRVTGVTALIGTLAIAGVPFLSGFFSKDAILGVMLTSGPLGSYGGQSLFAILMITAGITAFYMFRWYYLVFAGEPRDKKLHERAAESPRVMTVPLVILAVGSVIVGYVGLPAMVAPNWIAEWLAPATAAVEMFHLSVGGEWLLLLGSVAVAAIGLGAGYFIYVVKGGEPARRFGSTPLAAASKGAFGFDALYRSLFTSTGEGMADGVSALDRDVVDRGLVGLSGLVPLLGKLVVKLQSGYLRAYAFAMLLGAAALAIIAALTWVLA